MINCKSVRIKSLAGNNMITKENHIGAIFGSKPQKASELMVKLMSYDRPTIESYVNSLPTKYFETEDEYTWDIIGDTRRNIPLVEARREDGTPVEADQTANVGANTAPFYLVFSEDWFADGETIVGNLNEVYPVKIKGEPRAEGSNYVYEVETTGGNINGIPVERLLAGERFSVEAAYVENSFSRKVGDRLMSPCSLIAA